MTHRTQSEAPEKVMPFFPPNEFLAKAQVMGNFSVAGNINLTAVEMNKLAANALANAKSVVKIRSKLYLDTHGVWVVSKQSLEQNTATYIAAKSVIRLHRSEKVKTALTIVYDPRTKGRMVLVMLFDHTDALHNFMRQFTALDKSSPYFAKLLAEQNEGNYAINAEPPNAVTTETNWILGAPGSAHDAYDGANRSTVPRRNRVYESTSHVNTVIMGEIMMLKGKRFVRPVKDGVVVVPVEATEMVYDEYAAGGGGGGGGAGSIYGRQKPTVDQFITKSPYAEVHSTERREKPSEKIYSMVGGHDENTEIYTGDGYGRHSVYATYNFQ